jgi:hypothetical protein
VQIAAELAGLVPESGWWSGCCGQVRTVTAILNHEFHTYELHKLDTQYCDWAKDQVLSLSRDAIKLTTNESAYCKQYPGVSSLLGPLVTYFSILCMHAAATQASSKVGFYFDVYLTQLLRFAAEYKWSAVLKYHMQFTPVATARCPVRPTTAGLASTPTSCPAIL